MHARVSKLQYITRFVQGQRQIVRCSNDAIHMCYNYREYLERAIEYSGRRILSGEEMINYAYWTPY
jgi:hypothetical protein